jgi:hypothetical protein
MSFQACVSDVDTKRLIDLRPKLLKDAPGSRGHPPYLSLATHAGTPTFAGHKREGPGRGRAGIDYGLLPGEAETEICPVAAGVVIASRDAEGGAGMVLYVAHGLGWKSEYAHLKARFVRYRDHVNRRELIALMGASGSGATRGGIGVAHHLHLSLFGPAFTPLLTGVDVQHWPTARPGWQYVLDPEEFSVGGRDSFLLFSRSEDFLAHDFSFRDTHGAAVDFCDRLLSRLGDAEALKAMSRERWETETAFAYNVDQRIWFLWQRLDTGPHPFSPSEVEEYRATLQRFMGTVPRLTAPIVEPARRNEYTRRRTQPLAVYKGREL